MNTEIEHKFLVVSDEFLSLAICKKRICQGYLAVHPSRTVRVRRSDDRAFITVKAPAPAGSIARFEWEHPISLDDFDALFAQCLPGSVEKDRYIVPLADGLKVEVDVFHGRNEGLVLAEIELPSEDAPFDRPAFLGADVTGDPRFYNSYLAEHPFDSWK